MSGFEVAGIVLGSIPLLISTLEHYCEGVTTLQRWRKYKRELRSLIRNLETERVKLQNVCEKLLDGLVSLSQFEAMIKSPLSELWKRQEIHRKIRGRLWEASDVFEATICDVNSAIEEMTKRLDSQNDGKVSEFRRGVFTLRRSTYEDLLKRIKDGVSDLENLTDRNIELEPARRVRSQGKLLRILRDVSRSLYRALKASLDCGCKHDMGIKLERRSLDIMPGDDDEKVICELAFQLAFSSQAKITKGENNNNNNSEAVEQVWHELLIKSTPQASNQTSPLPLPSPPSSMQSAASAKRGKMKKSVSFGFSHLTASTTTTTTTTTMFKTCSDLQTSFAQVTTTMMSLGLSGCGSETALRLCEKLQTQNQPTPNCDRYGIIIDNQPGSSRRYIVLPSAPKTSVPWSLISLQEILEPKDNSIQVPLSYRDRLHLAVLISSSVLQLHGTPWLPESLNNSNIFFMKISGFPTYSHPLFLTEHNNTKNNNAKIKTLNSPQEAVPFTFDRNPRLLSLGYLLIELMLGQTLESLRSKHHSNTSFPPGSQWADYVTAQSVLSKVRAESLNYWTAVTRCIEGEFHQRGCGLDSEELCQDVYAGVVALLEKDLENSC